jgi:hypothetical protein
MPAPTPTSPPVLAYRSPPSSVTILADADGRGGVSISVQHVHERPWPLAIGFAGLAVVATVPVLVTLVPGGSFTPRTGALAAFAGFCTLLALAASTRSQTLPLELHADSEGLHMAGGIAGESCHWTRDEIVRVYADDPRDRPLGAEPFVISIEFRGDEPLVIPVPSAADQAAVAAALRGALNLRVPTSERLR